MNDGRRGTRSRVTEHSQKGAPLPEGTRSEGLPQSGDGDGRNSQGEHSDGTADTQTASQGNQGNDRQEGNDSTQDSRQSSSYGLTPEESARLKQIQQENAELKKGKANADKKITQQGQQLSEARSENEQLTSRIGQLEGSVTEMKTMIQQIANGNNGNGAGTGRRMDASYGNDDEFGDESDNDGNLFDNNQQGGNGTLAADVQQIKNVIGWMNGQFQERGGQFDQFVADQAREGSLAQLQTELGVDREAAETILDTHETGDLVKTAEVLQMFTVPSEHRRQARAQRERMRDATFQPGITGASPTNVSEADEAALIQEAERIMEMKEGRSKERAITKFISDNPAAYNALKGLSGFNVV